ncbi:adenylate/guanylate cyclase [Catenovulum agarivorans DS-2]|uniref:Adenylate/guanylate cyclase n=1 Tax=Catenovulum agarivorans DS-2 TaxID=1328313 RepID=W7Q8K1_9ALTE|nr:adenylate/guanylate cyclase [Catenovulum agarivorans DS-2]
MASFFVHLVHISDVAALRLLTKLEHALYDWQITHQPAELNNPQVVIANIDEKSIAELGQWPWRRDVLAQLLDRLFSHYQIKLIGFDTVFAESSDTTAIEVLDILNQTDLQQQPLFQQAYKSFKPQLQFDQMFAEQMEQHKVVTGLVFAQNKQKNKNNLPVPIAKTQNSTLVAAQSFIANLATFHQAASGAGFFDNPLLDEDGVFRRVPLLQQYQGYVYPSLALEMVRIAQQQNMATNFAEVAQADGSKVSQLVGIQLNGYSIPVNEKAAVLVPYTGAAYQFSYYSIIDILRQQIPLEQLKNKLVLLGTDSAGLLDLRTTPFAKAVPGVEVHASIIHGLLTEQIVAPVQQPLVMQLSLFVLLSILLLLLYRIDNPSWQIVYALAVLVGLFVVSFTLWFDKVYMPLASQVSYWFLTAVLLIAYKLIMEHRQKDFIVRRFGQYVPPSLVADMAKSPDKYQLQGQQKQLTVLFTDIRDFTRISEQLSANDLSDLMNQYLTVMTRIIHKHNGTIDKYMGDAIMAFWGAPIDNSNHAFEAVAAAVEMQQALDKVNKDFASKNWPQLQTGIGINTGLMHVGNMGSEFRMAYTVIGDEVNLASRLEGLTKQYGCEILLGELTFELVASSPWMIREIDAVRVKGKQQAVAIYQLCLPSKQGEYAKGIVSGYAEFLLAYRQQDWSIAQACLQQLFEQKLVSEALYKLFLQRINGYQQSPPPHNWDGVYTYQIK